MKALQCPFLSHLPTASIRTHAPTLLTIANQCPVMKHAVQYTKMASTAGQEIDGWLMIWKLPGHVMVLLS